MKKNKKILYLTTLILIIFVIGYFCSSFIILNDKEIKESYFINQKYTTDDPLEYIDFNDLENIVIVNDGKFYDVLEFSYNENIMIFKTIDKEINLIVINKNKIYCSTFNEYYYLYKN